MIDEQRRRVAAHYREQAKEPPMADRQISNCEQCTSYQWHPLYRRYECYPKQREIKTRGIPDWCPLPKVEEVKP